MIEGHLTEIDLGAIPSPSGAGALVLHAEEQADCLVVLQLHLPSAPAEHPCGLVTFEWCTQSIFGYPNDEAYWEHPDAGYGFYEVTESTWNDRLRAFNRLRFPDAEPSQALRHYFVGCHDASGQFLARNVRLEIFDQDYDTVVREALHRLEIL